MSKLTFCAFFVSFGTTLNILSTTMIRTTEAVEVVKSAKKTKVYSHEATPTTTTTTVSSLFVQVGKPCSMAQHADGFYTLRATIGKETVSLSERPNRLAGNVPTKKFVDSFNEELFSSSNPNAAITFADNGPLIVVLSHPKIVASRLEEDDDSTTNFVIEYAMEQTESQGEVASIEEFLNTSGSCSIFIDSAPLKNKDGCCNVPSSTANFVWNNILDDCYCTNCSSWDDDHDTIYNMCWSQKYFNADGNSESCTPHGDSWSSTNIPFHGSYGPPSNWSCGPPCATFESSLPLCLNTN